MSQQVRFVHCIILLINYLLILKHFCSLFIEHFAFLYPLMEWCIFSTRSVLWRKLDGALLGLIREKIWLWLLLFCLNWLVHLVVERKLSWQVASTRVFTAFQWTWFDWIFQSWEWTWTFPKLLSSIPFFNLAFSLLQIWRVDRGSYSRMLSASDFDLTFILVLLILKAFKALF